LALVEIVARFQRGKGRFLRRGDDSMRMVTTVTLLILLSLGVAPTVALAQSTTPPATAQPSNATPPPVAQTATPPGAAAANPNPISVPPSVQPPAALPGKAACGTECRPPPETLTISIIVGVVLLALVALLMVRKALAQSSGWKLGDALSEEADLTDAKGTPIVILSASSSRLIAFVGLIVLLSLYLGFGVFILYYFGTGQQIPAGLDDIEKFMLAGLTLFAPYAVNQTRAAVEGLTSTAPNNPTPQPAPAPAPVPVPAPVLAPATATT
jgi:hypothetical protein